MSKLIPISDTPSGFWKRKAQWRKFIFDDDEKIVKLICTIRMFVKLGEDSFGDEVDYHVNTDVQPYERILKATNETRINPGTGNPCYSEPGVFDEGGENEKPIVVWKDLVTDAEVGTQDVGKNPTEDYLTGSTVGYYDFFDQVVIQNPVNIPTLIANIVAMEDSIGGLNKKG